MALKCTKIAIGPVDDIYFFISNDEYDTLNRVDNSSRKSYERFFLLSNDIVSRKVDV